MLLLVLVNFWWFRVFLCGARTSRRGPWEEKQIVRERESHLLNPPPGSTDPERFATVSIGIGDRVLFHPAPENSELAVYAH